MGARASDRARRARRRRARGADAAQDVSRDMSLSMALWKAVSDRYQLLSATFDGGRVGRQERERLSALIWGRLDGTLDPSLRPGAGALAVSLPEACRLSDALAGAAADRAVAGARRRRQRRPDQGPAGPAGAAARPGRPSSPRTPATRPTAEWQELLERAGRRHGPRPAWRRRRRHARPAGAGRHPARTRPDRRQRPAPRRPRPGDRGQGAAGRPRRPGRRRSPSWRPPACAPSTRRRATPCPTCRRSARCRSPPAEISATGPAARPGLQALTLAQDRYVGALAERTELVDLLDAYVAKARALGVAGNADLVDQRAPGARRARPRADPAGGGAPAGHDVPDLAGQLLADHRPGTPRSPHEQCSSPAAPGRSSTATATCAGWRRPPAHERRPRLDSSATGGARPPEGCGRRRRVHPARVLGAHPRRLLRRLRLARRAPAAAVEADPVSDGRLVRPRRPAGCSRPRSARSAPAVRPPPAARAPAPSGCALPGSAPA